MRRECRERFPRHQLPKKPLVSDPGIAPRHVPWCMSGSLTNPRWRGKRSRCKCNPSFYVSGKRPIPTGTINASQLPWCTFGNRLSVITMLNKTNLNLDQEFPCVRIWVVKKSLFSIRSLIKYTDHIRRLYQTDLNAHENWKRCSLLI